MDTRIAKLIADFDAETNAISSRIDTLIANAGSSEEIIAGLEPISARLKALAADPAQPIPPAA